MATNLRNSKLKIRKIQNKFNQNVHLTMPEMQELNEIPKQRHVLVKKEEKVCLLRV